MSQLHLYWASGSPYAWRVMLALEVKRLSYESHLIEFSSGELKSDSYLRMNPRGRVPTLRDGDYVVYESTAILAYLEAKYPEVPLFGSTPEQVGNIWRAIGELASYCDDVFQPNIIRPLYFNKTGDAVVSQRLKETIPKLHAELARYEALAEGNSWLVGDAISAADIFLLPLLKGLERAAQKPAAKEFELGLLPLADKYPNLARLIERVEQVPGYDQTYPPHWR